jgi:integrase
LAKTGEPRHVPLSDYAIGWLRFLPQYGDSSWVFSLAPEQPLKEPKKSFKKGKNQAGLHWVRGLHDLRHYRATQWLLRHVDIQTVKCYLGHKRIETTQRYLHFVPGHAEKSVRAAQEAEAKALEESSLQSGRHMGDSAELAWSANVSNLPN